MGPDSKDAITRLLGHLIDELQQQRGVGAETLNEVRKLAAAQAHQKQDHDALVLKVAQLPKVANGRPK
jgi:hypothetical protein